MVEVVDFSRTFFWGQPLQLPYFFVDGDFFCVFVEVFGKKGGKWMIDRSWGLGKRCLPRPINLLIYFAWICFRFMVIFIPWIYPIRQKTPTNKKKRLCLRAGKTHLGTGLKGHNKPQSLCHSPTLPQTWNRCGRPFSSDVIFNLCI